MVNKKIKIGILNKHYSKYQKDIYYICYSADKKLESGLINGGFNSQVCGSGYKED